MNAMQLSRQTLEGLHITGELTATTQHFLNFVITTHPRHLLVLAFTEMTRYLLKLPDADGLFLLSERFSQDPLENYFGQQRSRGGRCDNPTVTRCLQNANALKIQRSVALDPVRGNRRRKKRELTDEEVKEALEPLQKRKRRSE